MATQIIEFEFDAGETLAVKLTPAATPATEYTADVVAEIRDGLYQATFDNQLLAIALYRIEVSVGAAYLGRGLVNITAAAGLFRETIEATAALSLSAESIEQLAGFVVTGINAEGVAVATALPAFLAQLAAAEIVFQTNPPQVGRMTLYSGCDHLQAAGNGKTFRNPAATWPNLNDYTVWLEVSTLGKSTREAAIVVVGEGIEQEICCEMRSGKLVAAGMTAGEGEFVIIAEKGEGQTLERIPLGGGTLLIKYGVAPAAAA